MMKRATHLLAIVLSSATLLGAASWPAAAQPGGPCGIASDDVLAQALGPAAHGVQAFSVPGLESCSVSQGDDANAAGITILHVSGPMTPQDLGAPIGPAGGAGPAPDQIQRTPVDGIGDSALLLKIPVGDAGVLVSLRVQRGADVYAFNTQDAADAPARLTALAQAVLASLG
jgi:hypothetical protein